MLCTVLTASRSRALSEGLTYGAGDLPVEPGMLVAVPLRGAVVEGVVLEADVPSPPGVTVKNIVRIESADPVLDASQLATLRWMAQYYGCSPRQAATVFLPPLPWSGLLKKPVRELHLLSDAPQRSALQRDVVAALKQSAWRSRTDIQEQTGASDAVLRTLLKNGVIEERTRREATVTHRQSYPLQSPLPVLSVLQAQADIALADSKKPSLLFGVTGSGKTELYMHRIAACAAQGKQTILLVPEILLSEEVLRRFEGLVGRERIAVLHSRLTLAARREQWRRIAAGDVLLVIGSRSALFAPCRHLGLVILDEEHEWTFKNEQTPRYHARETAEQLCKQAGAALILGSATPSLESWHAAKEGRFTLVRLPERFNNRALPSVRVIDLADVRFGKHYPFSPPLIEAVQKRLQNKEQCVLFLNRRGMATSVVCLDCRRPLTMPESMIPLVLHRTPQGKEILLDHATGQAVNVPSQCPACRSVRLLAVGAGTQKLEQSVAALFPSARVLRADADTLRGPEEIRTLLAAMRDRKADILLGTQSVVKGLDLPEVTLAAVLLADVGMSLPHFRAGERTFQLLTQLTGRSGRAKDGEVIIQTFRPDAVEVSAAAAHGTETYLDAELALRKAHGYPPYRSLVRMTLEGADARTRMMQLQKDILLRASDANVSVAPTYFGAGKVWHLLLRTDQDPSPLLAALALEGMTVDRDPVDCL